LSLRLKLAKLSADQVFTESEFHMVGAVTGSTDGLSTDGLGMFSGMTTYSMILLKGKC